MYKILQINCVYDYGSTGEITKRLHREVSKYGFQSVVLYGRREKVNEANVLKTCSELEAKANNLISRLTGRPYAVSPFGTKQLIEQLNKEKPDIVHLQCINGFFVNIYDLLKYLKRMRIPTVLTLHAEFMYTGNCGHAINCEEWKSGCVRCPDIYKAIHSLYFDTAHKNWMDMKSAFDGFDNLYICAVSDWVKMRAKQSPVLNQYHIQTILNGIETKIFSYREKEVGHFKRSNNLQEKKIILHVTADFQNQIKGGKYINALSNYLDPEKYAVIVVDGNDNNKPEEFQGIYWGRAKSQEELAVLYSVADVTVLTSERETFSMVCAESLCCGTPVIGFRAGAPEMIALADYSEFIEYGKTDELCKLVEKWTSSCKDAKTISENAYKKYGVKSMVDNYCSLYQRILL